MGALLPPHKAPPPLKAAPPPVPDTPPPAVPFTAPPAPVPCCKARPFPEAPSPLPELRHNHAPRQPPPMMPPLPILSFEECAHSHAAGSQPHRPSSQLSAPQIEEATPFVEMDGMAAVVDCRNRRSCCCCCCFCRRRGRLIRCLAHFVSATAAAMTVVTSIGRIGRLPHLHWPH